MTNLTVAETTSPAKTRPPARRRRTARQRLPGLGLYAYLTIVALFAIGPLLLAWSTAFKDRPQVVETPTAFRIHRRSTTSSKPGRRAGLASTS